MSNTHGRLQIYRDYTEYFYFVVLRPLIFARVKQHKAGDQTQEEMLKFIVYNMELSRTLFPLGSGIETSSVGELLSTL